MRAVQMLGRSQVGLIDVPDPEPGEGEVVVQIAASLLCGSELHGYRGEQRMATNGGHEAAGVVVDASRSRRWRDGDRVGIHAVWGCGACDQCARGRYTWCGHWRVCPGLHAELAAAPDHVLVPLPDEVDDEVGALLAGDGLGVPYHTSRRLPTRGGDTVVVVGCGPIGLGNILLHSFRGTRVIALDRVPERIGYAREMGADAVVDVSAVDALPAIRELTGGRLAEAAIEATGRPEGFTLALAAVGPGGTVACCGENGDVPLNVANQLIRRDITVFGSWFYHYAEYPDMIELYRRGLEVGRLVTHRWPLAEAATAYAEFAAGRVGKPALRP